MNTPSQYDVAIVGAGHNGLAAACYLANAGKKVVVLESQARIGGMSASGYLMPDAPRHLVHSCALDLMSLRVHPIVPAELELERHGFRQVEMSPAYAYLHPDGNSLVLWRDPQQTAAEIRRYSAKDAESFLRLMKVIDLFIAIAVPMMRVDPARKNIMAKLRVMRTAFLGRALRPELMALVTGSAYGVTLEYFEHPVTISAMAALTGAAGPITAEGSGIYFALLGFLHKFGVGRVIGGMQALPDAMASRLAELGGEVRTSAAVEEIVAIGGRVTGVRLKDGSRIQAKAVIASCHPKMALEMVTPGQIEKRLLTRIALAPANAHGASPLRVDLALCGQVSVQRHEAARGDGVALRKCVLLIGTAEAVLENFSSSARGEIPSLPYLWVTAPSAVDATQAPPSQEVVYLYPPAMPVFPREGWDAIREHAAAKVIGHASLYMQGLVEFEIARRIETSADLALRLNVHNGCVTHLDTSALRSNTLRPAYGLGGATLPVAGLYFGGAGIHPGGGVSGMPGRLAASRVKQFLK